MENQEFVSRLTASATVRTNQTVIQCLAGPNEFNLFEGEEVTLYVVGPGEYICSMCYGCS